MPNMKNKGKPYCRKEDLIMELTEIIVHILRLTK